MNTLPSPLRRLALALGLVLASGLIARADWQPGDPYKMHYPQLPDPLGWDVNFSTPKVLADDWLCTESGPVGGIHFWMSYRFDQPIPITSIHLSIHSDVPVGPDNPLPFSHPGSLLWEADFLPAEFTLLYPAGQGEQGWFDPNTGEWARPDHLLFGQVNINIPEAEAFVQQAGTIYWLDVSVRLPDGQPPFIGWKTTLDHFNDDAVWGDFDTNGVVTDWHELRDPVTQQSLDLAFVINNVPEPTTLTLSLLGGSVVLWSVRRGRRS